jgi:hypothetical protein
MSMHRLDVRAATVTVLAAGLVGGAVTLSPPAAAEPGRGDLTCAELLQRAAEWPGDLTVRGERHRVHSDAYTTYLTRQAPCASVD